MAKGDVCGECKGQQVLVSAETLEVNIPCGFPAKDKIVFHGKGNEHPDALAGDIAVVITVLEDPVFRRANNDLHVEQKISLGESLTGFSFNLKHVNGQEITLESPRGKVVNNTQVMKIPHLGMRAFKTLHSYGDLYVHFQVQMPESISEQQI